MPDSGRHIGDSLFQLGKKWEGVRGRKEKGKCLLPWWQERASGKGKEARQKRTRGWLAEGVVHARGERRKRKWMGRWL